MHRRLGDAEDGHVDRGADLLEAGIAEAGDDVGVGRASDAAALADLGEKTGDATAFVLVALDAGGTVDGVDRDDLGVGPGDGHGRWPDRRGHRRRGVGVDEQETHAVSLRLGAAPRRTHEPELSTVAAGCPHGDQDGRDRHDDGERQHRRTGTPRGRPPGSVGELRTRGPSRRATSSASAERSGGGVPDRCREARRGRGDPLAVPGWRASSRPARCRGRRRSRGWCR